MSEVKLPETICLAQCEGKTSTRWYLNSDKALGWAIKKFYLPEMVGVTSFIRSDLANDFCKIKNLEIQLEAEKAKVEKLKMALRMLIESCEDECRGDEDCDHCFAIGTLKEIEASDCQKITG